MGGAMWTSLIPHGGIILFHRTVRKPACRQVGPLARGKPAEYHHISTSEVGVRCYPAPLMTHVAIGH